jgi:endonuclease/exonuclease/phosphatase family metal-dependent hydrolase
VAGRRQRLAEQAERICGLDADLVCLQEVTPSSAPLWTALLSNGGWGHAALARFPPERPRPLGTLTAARVPITPVEVPDLPWPERVLATRLGTLEAVNVHSPVSPSPDLAKIRTHEAVHRHLASGSGPRLVCGDLNTPRREHPDGRIWTFARTRYGTLRPERGERWDQAELALIKGLESHGFRDAFRERHGPEIRELSWEWQRWGGGYRLDHLIVSPGIAVNAIAYLHDWRKAGLSDHSPLLASIAW